TATVSPTKTPGDYLFKLLGSGEDPNHIANQAGFTLKVVDFELTVPSPNKVTVAPGTSSTPIGFQVTAAGSFAAAVDLSCEAASLPAGVTCSFQPGVVSPKTGSPASVVLTIHATANAAPGTFAVKIDGSVPSLTNSPVRTQTVS